MTDQGTNVDNITENQSRLVEQLSKQQPQLTIQQLNNIQTVQKTIKRYQNKITQMLKMIQRQKKHNENLKTQLKTLNQTLNHMIQKINIKNQKKQSTGKQQDTVKKNLQIEIKKNVLMKKQLDTLRAKLKVFEGQRIIDLQDQIRQKDKVIEQLNNTIKMYEKIQKQQMNMDVYRKYNQANQKINSLNGELIHLKKKLTQAKKYEEQQEKSIKRQHQQLLKIQNKQKNVGIVFKKQQQKAQQANNEIVRLKEKIQTLQNAKKTNQKVLRIEIQNLKLKNKTLEQQLQQTKSKLLRKDKQSNILVSKIKSFSRRSHPSLQPIEKLPKIQEINSNPIMGLFDHRKEFKGLVHLQNTTRKFDDSEILPVEKSYRIKSIKFSWFQEHILSLLTVYELGDGTIKQLESFSISHSYKNTRMAQLNLSEFQYIKQIQLFCSKFIEFIRIKTSRDHFLQVGNEKNHTKCKKFTFEIRTNQKPIAMMGAIQNKKAGNQSAKEHLISFGVEIKRKDIFTKSKFNPVTLRSESLKKAGSSSKQAINAENDKNIIIEEGDVNK